ncbi:MAG TPA: ABC transporter permease subunit [Chloroflexota bacterium]|nr:ABC transporter permease subunit [Chloroflexota bacterium]
MSANGPGTLALAAGLRAPRVDWRERERLLGFVLLAPACLLIFGLILYPLVYDVAFAFSDASLTSPGQFVGLDNFGMLLGSSWFWIAARNSVLYTVLTSSVRLILGVGMALALFQLRRGRGLVFLALFVPWVFPAALTGVAFYWILSPPFHTFYTMDLLAVRWALADLAGDDVWGVVAIALHDIWRSSAFLAIFLLAGFNTIPSEQLDYAALECNSLWRRFWLVILPGARRFLVLALLLSLVLSFLDYTSMYVQTGGRITWPLIGTLAYQTSFFNDQPALSSAMTLLQLPVWLAVLWVSFRVFEREPRAPNVRELASGWSGPADWGRGVLGRSRAVAIGRVRPSPWPTGLGRVWHGVIGLAIVVFAIFPIWWIFLQAVKPMSEDPIGNPFWTWAPTLDGFDEVLHGRLVGQWLLNTGILLVVGIALTLGTSMLAGYALARLHVPGARWIARLLLASYFLPQPLVLIPIYQVFLWLRLDGTLLSVILLDQTLTIPFATWLLFTYFAGLPADIEEHAGLDGSRWTVFRHIVLPMSVPVLIAAGIFTAGIMSGDFVYAGLLLVHDQVKTIAVGLGLIGLSLDEFNSITGGIGAAAAPLVIVCAAFAPAYVRGLSAAMIEGS